MSFPPHPDPGRGAVHDVVVAGGGPAGAAAALVLSRSGRSVLLADAGTGPAKVGEALHPAAGSLLKSLGVDGSVPGDGHLPCYANRSAWGSPFLADTDFLGEPGGHGWHLDRALFDSRLRQAAAAAGARVCEHTGVRGVRREPEGLWSLGLSGPWGVRDVRCRWIVDATGRRAAVATRRGAVRRTGDRLLGVFVALPVSAAPASGAQQDGTGEDPSSLVEAEPDGWWYTALQPSRGRLLIYFTDADLPASRLRTAEEFRSRLAATRHVAARAARHPWPDGTVPRRVPAHSSFLRPASGDGWIAAGDAVAAFDPLSSQGLVTALYTGLSAGEALDARLSGRDGAMPEYAARLADVEAAYRRNHRYAYASEQRWAHRPFWLRRAHRPGAVSRRAAGGPGG